MSPGTNGANGNGTVIPVTTPVELETRVAQYRTALVALVAMLKRDGGWRSTADQQLLRQIERLLDSTP